MSSLTSRKSAAPRHPAICTALGAAYGLAATIALLAIAALLTTLGFLPESLMPHTTVLSSFCGTLLGSHIALKRTPDKKLLVSLGSAAIFFVITFASGKAISGEAGGANVTLASIPAILGGGALAGIVQSRQKRTKRH